MSTRLPPGSLIAVTGANGSIASHICDQLLALGYRVRGTVRQPEKRAWVREFFDKKYGPGKFELVELDDFRNAAAFDAAAKGCSGFVHCASDLGMNLDPKISVQPVIDGVENALKACAKEPSVKSFVLTSSSMAAGRAVPNKKWHMGKDTWNDADIKEGWADTWTDEKSRMWAVYGASKAGGEKAMWKFAEEKKPHFSVNAILPNLNTGWVLVPEHQPGSAGILVHAAYDPALFARLSSFLVPQHYIDVVDDAKLHAAVVTDPGYNGERLFAFAAPFTWTESIEWLKKTLPHKETPAPPENEGRDLSTVENERALEVLKERYGQTEWTSFDDTMKASVKSLGLM